MCSRNSTRPAFLETRRIFAHLRVGRRFLGHVPTTMTSCVHDTPVGALSMCVARLHTRAKKTPCDAFEHCALFTPQSAEYFSGRLTPRTERRRHEEHIDHDPLARAATGDPFSHRRCLRRHIQSIWPVSNVSSFMSSTCVDLDSIWSHPARRVPLMRHNTRLARQVPLHAKTSQVSSWHLLHDRTEALVAYLVRDKLRARVLFSISTVV